MKIAISEIVSAFAEKTVGSRVVNSSDFFAKLEEAIETHDPSTDRTPGQHFVSLPEDALGTVSAGVGQREGRGENDYTVVEHRGKVGAYLKREFAAPVDSLAAIVYTREAYEGDPEVSEEEMARIGDEASHILVAVLASAGPKPPRTPFRMVASIAGENRDYDWLQNGVMSQLNPGSGEGRCKVDISAVRKVENYHRQIVNDAFDSISYDREWSVVSD